MIERYGDAAHFLSVMTPALDTHAARHPERAYTGPAPTLHCVAAGYGEATALVWLCMEIEDINTFSAARVKLSVDQQMDLARMILAGYGYLKVSEVLLFVYRLKSGHYERFYGAVDAQAIMLSLLTFATERRNELALLREAADRARKAAEEADRNLHAVSREEYLRKKQQNNANLTSNNLKNTENHDTKESV